MPYEFLNVGEILDDYIENGEFYETMSELIDKEVKRRTEDFLNSVANDLKKVEPLEEENRELKGDVKRLKAEIDKVADTKYCEGYENAKREMFGGFDFNDTVWFVDFKIKKEKCGKCSGGKVIATLKGDEDVKVDCPHCDGLGTDYYRYYYPEKGEIKHIYTDITKKGISSLFLVYSSRSSQPYRKLEKNQIYKSKKECENEANKRNENV